MSFVLSRSNPDASPTSALADEHPLRSDDLDEAAPSDNKAAGQTIESQQQAAIVAAIAVVLVAVWCGLARLLRPLARAVGGGKRLAVAAWVIATLATLAVALTLG